MARQRSGVIAALLGASMVAFSKAFLVWAYGPSRVRYDGVAHPQSDYTLEDISTMQHQVLPYPRQISFERWQLWTLLLGTGVLSLLGLTLHGRHALWRRLALIAGSVGAAATLVEAVTVLGPRYEIYARTPGATFHGLGPGPFAAVAGFLLLGLAPTLVPEPAPVLRGRMSRVATALGLTLGGACLVLWSVNGLAWYVVGHRDQPTPFGFHELLRYLGFYRHYGLVETFFLGVLGPLVVVAGLCPVTAVLRPGLSRVLRPIGVAAGVLAPVLTFAALAYQWRGDTGSPADPPSHNPLDSMAGGFWALAVGCLLLAAAAVVAPGQKTIGQKTPGQKTIGQWADRPTGPNASDAA